LAVRVPPVRILPSPARALHFHPPLASIIPAFDAVALASVCVGFWFRPAVVVFAVLTFLILYGDSSRVFRINPRIGDDAGWLLGRVSIALAILLGIAASGINSSIGPHVDLATLAFLAPVGVAAVFIGRAIAYSLGRSAKAHGKAFERTVIVGGGEVAVGLARTLQENQEFGLRPVGFVGRASDEASFLPFIGGCGELDPIVREHEVTRILVAWGETDDRDLATILRESEYIAAEIHVVPRFFELSGVPQGAAVDDLAGFPLLHLRRPALRPAARVEKRLFDILGSSLLLLLASPLLAIVALAIRVSSPGPILFRQKRVGLSGEVFEILKFRTMNENDDSDVNWSDDERVTPVGRLLRSTSIDELPQLLNVLRGEMSLVGPRPERPHFTGQFAATVSRYDDRHRVPGGMTGWAQVHGLRGAGTSIPDRVRFDNYYIENWSLWRDLVIMARTIGVLLRGEGR
jgi:exopolysaccharide biosynthesis polyprenyl glycosylphosphotransferase